MTTNKTYQYREVTTLLELLTLADDWMRAELGWAMRNCKIVVGQKIYVAINPGYRPANHIGPYISWHEQGSHPALYKPEVLTRRDVATWVGKDVQLVLQTEDYNHGSRDSVDTRPWRVDRVIVLAMTKKNLDEY